MWRFCIVATPPAWLGPRAQRIHFRASIFGDLSGDHVAFYRVSGPLNVEELSGDSPLGFTVGFASLPLLLRGSAQEINFVASISLILGLIMLGFGPRFR